ncbi:MAG: amidohydrolase family protein [Dehalococcoidia bacterium]|nr:amidohydrolase family protein [Dehalococcoidia bacterium]
MTTIITDTTIVTCDPQRAIHYGSGMAIEDGRIVAIGPSDEVEARYPDAERVDGRGRAVFPGFVNCHTHMLATADRGILEDFGFPTTLKFPTTGRGMLDVDERNVFIRLAAAEAIRSGTTSLLEISDNIPQYADRLADTGLRLFLSENFNDIDDEQFSVGRYEFSEAKLEAGLQRSVDLISSWHGQRDGRVQCFVSPHAPELCSPALLRRAVELADEHGLRYTIHLSQSSLEVEGVMRTRGVRPTQYLFANDFLSDRLVVAHCRYVDDSEIALLGQHSVAISNNPAIAARRGAAAPAFELEAAGCPIGMGSDNMAEDMVEVVRAALFHERVRRNDEMWPQPEDVLDWATIGGARALGVGDKVGSLEVGKKADLFMVDLRRSHLVPTLRVVSVFVHQAQPADITDLMVDGAWVMRDSRILAFDEDDVIARSEAIGHKVWSRLVDENPDVPFPVRLPPGPLVG